MKTMSTPWLMRRMCAATVLVLGVWDVSTAYAQSSVKVDERAFVRAAKSSYLAASPQEWQRLFDPTLAICNATGDAPNERQALQIMKREQASIHYPSNGQLMGDWRRGKEWAEQTHGGRIGIAGFADADDPRKPNGANCYACHAIDPAFPQAGNMGPPLTHYGRLRGVTPEVVRATYDKIFNAKATNPCSIMPRYGGKDRLLTPEQVADIVAFLLDPQSPVNKE
ncbi:sulfur oxidation c-type cytochrome SoxX [Tepidimonas alkaliphilus]|uniref:Sulfur oxidation c-type cytochrome SoxX n=1 Tax=Tepidimonas alkaliphilus TaxID=2588942 RepID=A0A554WBJ1_9BURK|nr:sulfur oxidation c-type cytochrome SoxX [Tepidimonas alkaliphilus]TSE20939.1 sulfur oxidation c-type cytochrome SoxX [Tepidimonas alkaliphilus]